ncbi:hypothetical protein HOLleu_33408 [Holothuria leucospilota]|uniref:Sulfotransferase n=1 Tax=Holothuria leucospilota TaxID=206669 RepID=A0A9Q0YNM4_HOLLE|nr:hypothetical protein HOLleu_33408 [Holothuria leucospilota]
MMISKVNVNPTSRRIKMASEKNLNDYWGRKGNLILVLNVALTGLLLLEVTMMFFEWDLQRYSPFTGNILPQTVVQDSRIPREFFTSLIATSGNVCKHNEGQTIKCNSALPNFFLSSLKNTSEPRDKVYEKSVITFVHAPKCGGTTMKDCLTKLAALQGKPPPHLLHKSGRFIAQMAIKNENDLVYRSIDYFMGSDSWGFCSYVNHRDCSYFTIMRDPYDRLVSLYFECKKQNNPPGEGRKNCVQSDIVDWVLRSRPLLSWLQLHRTVECGDDTVESCSFRVLRKQLEHMTYNDTYIKSITNNLEKVFAVIGITEDFPTTYRLLQATYGIPFYDECNGTWLNSAVYTDHDVDGFDNFESLKEHLKSKLKNNSKIHRMVYADVKLYEKAKEIFQKQKETLNKNNVS